MTQPAARMLGTWSRPWCPRCRAPAGPDCPDASVPRKTRRAREKDAWKREAREQTDHGYSVKFSRTN